jgi:hypothetical protein
MRLMAGKRASFRGSGQKLDGEQNLLDMEDRYELHDGTFRMS